MDESQNNSRQHPSFVAEHKISYNIKCFSSIFLSDCKYFLKDRTETQKLMDS